MKVIKKGTYGPLKRRFTCKVCDSIIEVTKHDGKLVLDARDGDYYDFKCPICETKKKIAKKLLVKKREY